MNSLRLLSAACLLAGSAFGQVGEFAFSGGVSRFGGASLGTVDNNPAGPKLTMNDGFRLGFRFTLNSYRFFGHEFGYTYSRSGVSVPASGGSAAQTVSVPIHQGVYNFLAYATPEGTRIRPFATGGGHFSSFFPPGTSIYSGNQITKFGFNYGGGIKARVTDIWGVRFDFRQYVTTQPFDFANAPSTLRQTEVSAGVSFNF